MSLSSLYNKTLETAQKGLQLAKDYTGNEMRASINNTRETGGFIDPQETPQQSPPGWAERKVYGQARPQTDKAVDKLHALAQDAHDKAIVARRTQSQLRTQQMKSRGLHLGTQPKI